VPSPVTDRRVEVEVAVGDEDHGQRGGERFGDGPDGEARLPGHPTTGPDLDLASLYGHGLPTVVDRELSAWNSVATGQAGQHAGA
jgi:hypothetical protein